MDHSSAVGFGESWALRAARSEAHGSVSAHARYRHRHKVLAWKRGQSWRVSEGQILLLSDPRAWPTLSETAPPLSKAKRCQEQGGWAGPWPCGGRWWQPCAEVAWGWAGCGNLARDWKCAVSSFVNASSLQCCHLCCPAKTESSTVTGDAFSKIFFLNRNN